MNRRDHVETLDPIDAALRSLDPADRHIDPRSRQAQDTLHAILASDPDASPESAGRPVATPNPHSQPRARKPRRALRRLVLAGAAAATIAVGIGLTPTISGGDRAFATWTAVPEDIPAEQRPQAGADCRELMKESTGGEYLGPDYTAALESAEVAVAERRGVWTVVVLAGPGGFSALCVTDDSASLFNDGMIGSIGVPTDAGPLGPRDLLATDLGTGSMNGRDISLAAGQSGSDVVGVVYHSPSRGDVVATVSHGRFALWLPGGEFRDASSRGVEVEVTYRDGSTASTTLTLD